MNRAMFSGVSGMKSHQTKMDVIGNNISNVNTYGYKSQRAVFSDIYYQNLRSASAGNANRGGTNPSSVGYGSTLSAIQAQMTQSSMQNTGFGLDVAIAGEGFLQVMDPEGSIFYTKAGMLDYDANGYLTDINGNFVLGSTDVGGAPGSQKIKLDNVGSVEAKTPTTTIEISGVKYTVTASNADAAANISIGIKSSDTLPAGLKASATISSGGAIEVKLNATELFSSMDELNKAINDAIVEANGGKQVAAGTITIAADKNVFGKDATNGSFVGNALQQPSKIEVADPNTFFDGCLAISGFDPLKPLTGDAAVTFTTTYNAATGKYKIETNAIDGDTFISGEYTAAELQAKIKGDKLDLTSTGTGKKITLEVKKTDGLLTAFQTAMTTPPTATAKPPKYFLGGVKDINVSADFKGQGTMTFDMKNLVLDEATTPKKVEFDLDVTVGGKSYQIVPIGTKIVPGATITLQGTSPTDTMTMTIPSLADMEKNFGVLDATSKTTTFKNMLEGSTKNHTFSGIAATAASIIPLTGAEIAQENTGVKRGTISGIEKGVFGELMTFIKSSSDFSGSGATDFKAQYTAATADSKAKWTVTMTVGTVPYTAVIDEDTTASSILLKGPAGDHVEMKNPTFKELSNNYTRQFPNTPLANNAVMDGLEGGATATATPSTPSRNMGLSTSNITLVGGTVGGLITLDQLTNITIGPDGSVSVSHPDKGTIVAGKISIANFANASGMQLKGNSYYEASANSGDPVLCDPGTKGSGGLKNNSLEMSNVDLSSEFADMITTQRGFQANSRVITVSDTMLEELINLKR